MTSIKNIFSSSDNFWLRYTAPRCHLHTSAVAPTAPTAASALPTPLVDALLNRGNASNEAPFHVPGHKRGARVPPAIKDILGQSMRYDLTELDGLDYLSFPGGPIAEAQSLAARLWGADASWFLVNGTTVGIHAAVMATCSGPYDALILPRNAHLSGFNAAALAGCTPVYAMPQQAHHMAHHLTPEELDRAFVEAMDQGLCPKAAMVVSPTYFGILSDVEGLSAVCHSHGAVLIVDEAHGAHLKMLESMGLHAFHGPEIATSRPGGGLMVSGLSAGADVVVQSTHKQLGALTQGAMLHVKGPRVDAARISRALQLLQTSSPSYLVMASLDAARAQAADPEVVAASHAASTHINTWFADRGGAISCTPGTNSASNNHAYDGPRLRLLLPGMVYSGGEGNGLSSHAGPAGRDPWRFTVMLEGVPMAAATGWDAAAALEHECGVVAELATHNAIVFAAGIGTTMQHAEALTTGLEWLAEWIAARLDLPKSSIHSSASHNTSHFENSLEDEAMGVSPRPRVVLSPREALMAATESVPASRAIGRVAAELLCPYPPGIPLVCPGDMVSEGVVAELMRVVRAGGKVVGATDATLETMRVVAE